MEHRIIVAGIGPGNPAYMIPEARHAIDQARCLVGGRRALAQYARKDRASQRCCTITRDIEGVLTFIENGLADSDVVVMVSGDPGYYSLLDALRRRFSVSSLQVIPGISSFQLAFARLALPWHGASLLSFHGRVPDDQALTYGKGRLLGLLTDHVHTSQTIAADLLTRGWPPDTFFAICSRLSYDDESVRVLTLQEAATCAPVGSCVIVVRG